MHSIEEATKAAEVILIAMPPTAVVEIAKGLGELTNKIVIDATNSVFAKPGPYNNASEVLRDLTKCQNVVKCFNSTGF